MGKKVKRPSCGMMFSDKIYTAEAVKLAAYVFSDTADIKLSPSAEGIEVEVSGGAAESSVAGEFANEVLNQQCRLDLAVKNGKISSLIVTKALLSASGETEKRG